MLCENCKQREANVKYKQIINGVKKEMNLCDKCSKELGISGMDFNMPINFSSFFGEFLNEYNNGFMPLVEEYKPLQCEKCKMTYDEFVNTSKFGCDNCYEVFSENIDPILKRLHGNNQYMGRKISHRPEEKGKEKPILVEKVKKIDNKNEEITKLKAEIKKMIKEEKYEEAAKIRDKIKKLEEN